MLFVPKEKIEKVISYLRNVAFEVNKYEFLSNIESVELDGKKIRYEHISNYIGKLIDDERIVIEQNARICLDIIDEKCKDEEYSVNELLIQILNHILLEVPRAIEYNSLESKNSMSNNILRSSNDFQRKANKKFLDMENEFKDFNSKLVTLNELEEKYSNLQNEFIGILSIFSAVIIGFFGGLNVIGSALSNMHNVSKYRLIFVVIVVGMVMFNVIYMLLNQVAILANRKLDRSIKECSTCADDNRFKCMLTKHPYLFYYNLLSVISLIYIYIYYIIDKYDVVSACLNIIPFVRGKKEYIPLLGLIMIILISILPNYYIGKFIRKSKCIVEINTDECSVNI